MSTGETAQIDSEQPEKSMDSEVLGEVTSTVAVAEPPVDAGAGGRTVDALSVTERMRREGRWAEVEQHKNQLIRDFHANGLTRAEARTAAYAEINRLYPPNGVNTTTDPAIPEAPPATDTGVTGLDDLPGDWPTLPANASLQAEIAWVAANRLLVSVGPDAVDLSRSLSPAPSHAAIGWLETSIRAYSKYCDIAARATAQQEQGAEAARRERMACGEIEALLEAIS